MCNQTVTQWRNSSWRSGQVGAMQYHNWENSSCSIFKINSFCSQGSIPVIAVNATWPEHVQMTIKYAASNNLRLVIKSTGHDVFGRSTAGGSLLLWLHHMKNKTLIEQFSSCNASSVLNAVRLGAGVQWSKVYKWLALYNLTVIGGICDSVSAVGGYLQGGGHSPLSRWKGMAVDQVLEYDVVTANGQRQTVNACQNSNLFWALRGGGGGTYAIVLSAVVRTYPTPYIVSIIQNIKAPNETRYARLIRDFVRLLPSLADIGWSGYLSMVDTNISITLLWPNGNFDVANATLNDFANQNTDFESANPTGINGLVSSRLIPEKIIRNKPNDVAQVFLQMKGQSKIPSNLFIYLVAGGQVSNTSNTNNSVNPAWRSALLHVYYARLWSDEASVFEQEMIAKHISCQVKILDALSDDSKLGSYMNEADPNEPDWQERFFGSQIMYDRLKSIKQKVDPLGLFVCRSCVGSDDWTEDLNCPKSSNSVRSGFPLTFVLIQMFLLAY
ncbi:unnamed protein product [Rotaria sp. Silwood2]|nr:unnamed protein product [Rotaria sp. Silwood2]CAF4718853.1 unnamed protein product [Rotaria sp. Silwood2]